MNYIGSKHRLSAFLKKEIKAAVGGSLGDKVFCDMFAGTGVVGRIFKQHVKKVISNDLEHYSYVLNKNYIQNSAKLSDKESYIKELNELPLREGFIYSHYCMGSGSGRQYFSDDNGKKIDAIRTKIEEFKSTKEINNDMYYFLLASLIESADRVANTASMYAAFLKTLKKPAQRKLILEPAEFQESHNRHDVYQEDGNSLINKIQGDILYLDPPYNHRQYGANYHILNTIALYDDFAPKGKTGMRVYNRSVYCKKNRVRKSFEELIKNADFKYIFLSYNNEGIMSKDEVKYIMSKYGKYDLKVKAYKKFKTDKKSIKQKSDLTYEYLHILQKD
ncbi:MAG: modification methylase [Sulfurimonas sp. RIFOXYD12_FULL_33_39]|uniref:DNA adenine methylase n=1 Tax=unclassified Sulfurimonas TaxID=2623549 RepID=UPI0008CCFEA3|nr:MULTISPECIES: DNA adenine methylase [unclassified Sulfurimonas]OHE06765.1 MAG: modification methylase [Sulfurimonas sp. RIFCSPLOWO2_12_FULL_34_6]OHE10763.1 MAG: modification methylase [Sulfurimonas sp. RIFOXYD12_FULL_33_39]OHE13467.1 MAG: modification methylase [Sulfurimonas sp. RIFOXYD2_FULL_34_21]